jgi:hypothetical protein
MIHKFYQKLIYIVLILISLDSLAQPFETIGSAYNVPAIQNSNCENTEACFTLTDNILWQQGAVWDLDTLDLTQAFDATFCMFIGADDGGADGFAFVMRAPNSNNYGEEGGGIGYGTANGTQGIFPSVAIEFDSFYNPEYFDIQEDHTALVINANVTNPPAINAIPLLPDGSNVEDNNFHNSRIVWDPVTQMLSMYFDGNLRFTYTNDIINTVFNGNSKIIWGFTASTGGMSNLHQICFPKIIIEVPDQIVCFEDSVEVSFYHENLTEYYWETPSNETLLYWNSGMGTPLTDTSFFASEPGEYELYVEFNNKIYSTTFNLTYDNSPPVDLGPDSSFCEGQSITLSDLNNTSWSNRLWSNNSTGASLQVTNPGTYWFQVSNIPQCVYRDSIVIGNFPLPTVNLLPFDSIACSPGEFFLEAQTQSGSSLTWVFEDGTIIQDQTQVNYSNAIPGDYGFVINVVSENSCEATFAFNDMIHVLAIPNADFSILVSDSEYGNVIQLNNESSNYTNLVWSYNINESSVEENPWFLPNENENTIQLIAFNGICSDTIVKYEILEDLEVIVPNIITNPGTDSPNSILTLFNDSFLDFEVEILNRWGNQVYKGKKDDSNPLYLWNGVDKSSGKACTDGVYYILLEGELKNLKPFKFQGFVTIAGN